MSILGFSVRGGAKKISKHLLTSLHGVVNKWDKEDKNHYPAYRHQHHSDCDCCKDHYDHTDCDCCKDYHHDSDCDCHKNHHHHSDCDCHKDHHHHSDCDCDKDHHHSNCDCNKHHHKGAPGSFLLGQPYNQHSNGHFVGKNCDVPLKISPFFFGINNPRLNFNGLNGNLAFQLFRFKGCKVRIFLECPDSSEEVEGIICNVGTNFVDILKYDEKVVTVLIEHICKIEWLDKHCNPCPVCYFPCNEDHSCPHCGGVHEKMEEVEESDHFSY